MSGAGKVSPRFRLGDWVSFTYGTRKVRAQVIEDRGPIGVRGRRLYRIRFDYEQGESTTTEIPEEDLEPAPEPERAAGKSNGTTSIHRTVTYLGEETDSHGMPSPWYHYLLTSRPGPNSGSGVASILPLSESRATGVAQGSSRRIAVDEGGPEAALSQAEQFLDDQHAPLKKIASDIKA